MRYLIHRDDGTLWETDDYRVAEVASERDNRRVTAKNF